MSGHLNWLPQELQSLSHDGLLRKRHQARPLSGRMFHFDGREVWDFASNDYLGLANDKRVVAAAVDAIHKYGVGAKASPLVSGRTDQHAELERALADFEGTEAAILFPTGMAANLGTIAALAGPDDAVYCDRFNHASLVDGCRLSGAKLRVYRHDDLDGLRRSLGRESARRKFLITDSVFSMDGDLAPLPELCEIAERYDATLILDEAHGTGVFGETGRGVAELHGVEERIAVRIGTLSKAIGSLGGFVAGSQTLVDYLWNKARTQIYSTALPPALCAAATESLKIIRAEPLLRHRLHQVSALFRAQLQNLRVSVYPGSEGPIVPVLLHQPQAAIAMAESLLASGFLVGAIRPPSVPRETSRLRITLNCNVPDDVAIRLANLIGELFATESFEPRAG